MNWIIRNPYYYAGAIVARVATCAATMLWAGVVLINEDALRITPYGKYVTGVVHENYVAVVFMAACFLAVYRLIKQHPPRLAWAILYAIMFVGWASIALVALFVQRPIHPTAFSTVPIIAALAAYAFISNPKNDGDRRAGVE